MTQDTYDRLNLPTEEDDNAGGACLMNDIKDEVYNVYNDDITTQT